MKRVIFALGILFVFATCKKTEVSTIPPTPVVQEEAIKFTTNLDTGTYNVADTLPLSISVSSKLPSAGLIYSITATWTDSSKQIYKLDTNLNNSNLSLNIPGLKKAGNYTLSIIVTSKSTSTNSFNKTISVVNNPLGRFMGYKVDQISLAYSRQKDFGKSYWLNVGVPGDIMVSLFQSRVGFLNQISYGDFNNDGYIDIFNAGSSYKGPYSISTFLIWDTIGKRFVPTNLYNNPADSIFGGNKFRTIPIYLNGDKYVDYVIYDSGDEGYSNSPNEPIRIVLSDGKGKYDLKQISTNENEPNQLANHKESGDIGDLNGDGIPDIVINCGGYFYIYWGISSFPYFTQNGRAVFTMNWNIYPNTPNDNGFGEKCFKISRTIHTTISDINGDGKNDLIFAGADDGTNTRQFLMINQGGGRFNDNGLINLPSNGVSNESGYIVEDINNDGLNDLITLNHELLIKKWNFCVYLQQKDGSFIIDQTFFKYSNLIRNDEIKFSMYYNDINNDGKKDIGYYDNADNGQLINKTVFIREGNLFVERDFFQFDAFAKSNSSKLK